jgi:hypothetical protein
MSNIRFVGLDVHAETIAVAVAEAEGEVRSLGVIANQEDSIRRLVKKLGPVEQLRACYEAGPTGYVVYWQLTALGVSWGSSQNGSSRRREAGAELSFRGSYPGLGAGCGPRSTARPGTSKRNGEEGPLARAKPAQQVPVTAWAATPRRYEGLDKKTHDLD